MLHDYSNKHLFVRCLSSLLGFRLLETIAKHLLVTARSYKIKTKILPQLTPISEADAAETLKRILTLL